MILAGTFQLFACHPCYGLEPYLFFFFHSLGNLPLSKQGRKISVKGLQIETSQIFTILILTISFLEYYIIFRRSLFGKLIVFSDLLKNTDQL